MKPKPWQLPIERAYLVCENCGLEPDEIGNLIVGLSGTTLTSEQAVELYRETFDEPEDAELCLPCAEAVASVAEESS